MQNVWDLIKTRYIYKTKEHPRICLFWTVDWLDIHHQYTWKFCQFFDFKQTCHFDISKSTDQVNYDAFPNQSDSRSIKTIDMIPTKSIHDLICGRKN